MYALKKNGVLSVYSTSLFPSPLRSKSGECHNTESNFYLWFDDLYFALIWSTWLTGSQLGLSRIGIDWLSGWQVSRLGVRWTALTCLLGSSDRRSTECATGESLTDSSEMLQQRSLQIPKPSTRWFEDFFYFMDSMTCRFMIKTFHVTQLLTLSHEKKL